MRIPRSNNAPDALSTANPRNASWYDPMVSYMNAATRGVMKTDTLLIGSMSPARREKFSLPNTSALRTVHEGAANAEGHSEYRLQNTITSVMGRGKGQNSNGDSLGDKGHSGHPPRAEPVAQETAYHPPRRGHSKRVGQHACRRQFIYAYVNQRRYLVYL